MTPGPKQQQRHSFWSVDWPLQRVALPDHRFALYGLVAMCVLFVFFF
jgi:hypothetical protein